MDQLETSKPCSSLTSQMNHQAKTPNNGKNIGQTRGTRGTRGTRKPCQLYNHRNPQHPAIKPRGFSPSCSKRFSSSRNNGSVASVASAAAAGTAPAPRRGQTRRRPIPAKGKFAPELWDFGAIFVSQTWINMVHLRF